MEKKVIIGACDMHEYRIRWKINFREMVIYMEIERKIKDILFDNITTQRSLYNPQPSGYPPFDWITKYPLLIVFFFHGLYYFTIKSITN